MRKVLISLVIAIVPIFFVQAQCDCGPLERIGISLNAGTLGVGLEASTSLSSNLAVRVGADGLLFPYNYNYEGNTAGIPYTVKLKAEAKLFNGHVFIDFFPFPSSVPFHLTAGVVAGTPQIITVSGTPGAGEIVEIGDISIDPGAEGKVEASLKVNSVKPYVGIGFGRSVPRSHVGFKCELGAMYQGTPQIEVVTGKLLEGKINEKLSDFNKLLNNFNMYPVLKLQLIFAL
ncbi:hypothetical protein EZS27_000989 [termite gut metagenome]|uniref:Outer membrane protein beta-barrel domain-containing protein n=1 Tax=termite gut metagenome TaxID=433724 RepID=A0A5J4T089_9ZZZZ